MLGGSSELGTAIAARLASAHRATVVLAGRHPDALAAAGETVLAAGAGRVELLSFDATETADHDAVVARAVAAAGDLDVVVVAFGLLGSQLGGALDAADAVEVATTNFVGGVSAGLAAARQLRRQGRGTLVVLSSVAGERVRRANFVYGSSKAGLDGFAQGLGDALGRSGAGVLIVRPGWVRGRMTAGRRPALLPTTPEAVARATEEALVRGRDVIWVPSALRGAFIVLRHLPRRVWRRVPG